MPHNNGNTKSSKPTPLKFKTELREFLTPDLKLLIASFKALKQNRKQVLLKIVAASGVRIGEKNIEHEIKGIYLSKSKIHGKYTLEDACAKVLDCVSEKNHEWTHNRQERQTCRSERMTKKKKSVVHERLTEIFDTRSLL